MQITKDIISVGVNDRNITLFEGQYTVEKGMAYNSYLIVDEKIAVIDSVEASFGNEWADNIKESLDGRKPDYLIVQHMEPDHSANVAFFLRIYPEAKVVSSAKAFKMMGQFFGDEFEDRRIEIKEGDTLCLGKHTLSFIAAPMVHWPEVMMTYDSTDKVLFSADGFGKFGTTDAEEPWEDEARRYYIGIVGKYGAQVQAVLKKAAALDIEAICPLHGPMLMGNLEHYISLYDTWSSYKTESEGILVAYASIYSGTKKAALKLAEKLENKGAPEVQIIDLTRCDIHEAVSEAFRLGTLVLASPTYNGGIFPAMSNFIEALTERGYQNRTVAFIENGTWAPMSAKLMKAKFEKSKNIAFAETVVSLKSTLSAESNDQIEKLSDELTADFIKYPEKDMTALFKIGYGLYVVTCHDGQKDTGLIVNTVSQLTSTPGTVSVTVNKDNYSHHVIKKTGKLNVCCLSTSADFKVFQRFGFQSGRNADKFDNFAFTRSKNGLAVPAACVNSYMSLEVQQYVDLGTHGMFICLIKDAKVLSNESTMSYEYYHANVKPKPKAKKGYVCKICGYVYEGDELPEDFVCPICKHGANDFEKL